MELFQISSVMERVKPAGHPYHCVPWNELHAACLVIDMMPCSLNARPADVFHARDITKHNGGLKLAAGNTRDCLRSPFCDGNAEPSCRSVQRLWLLQPTD